MMTYTLKFTAEEIIQLKQLSSKFLSLFKICPFCYKEYLPPPNNPDKQNCGSKSCHKKHLIKSHGGIEGYKEWERNRKRNRIIVKQHK